MRVVELFVAYPEVKHAISYIELFLSQNEFDCRDLFAAMIEQGWGPAEAVSFLRKNGDDEIRLDDFGDREMLIRARREMDHPSFLTYIAGKMGAV